MPNINDFASGGAVPLFGAKFTTIALGASATASVGDLGGAAVCIFNNSAASPGTFTTRTALQMIADHNLQLNQAWLVLICQNNATGTLTLGGGVGVTVSGTATVAPNVARPFIFTMNSLTTLTAVGSVCSWTVAV